MDKKLPTINKYIDIDEINKHIDIDEINKDEINKDEINKDEIDNKHIDNKHIDNTHIDNKHIDNKHIDNDQSTIKKRRNDDVKKQLNVIKKPRIIDDVFTNAIKKQHIDDGVQIMRRLEEKFICDSGEFHLKSEWTDVAGQHTDISIETLRTGFNLSNGKNTLGIDTRKRYFFPLIFNVEDAHNCTVTDIMFQVNLILPAGKIKKDLDNTFYAEQCKPGEMHIYVDCMVSCVVYDYLLRFLNQKFRGEATFIDDEYILPLPMHTNCNDADVYTHIAGKFKLDYSQTIYDYEYEGRYNNDDHITELFTTIPVQYDPLSVEYVYKCEIAIQETCTIPTFIKSIMQPILLPTTTFLSNYINANLPAIKNLNPPLFDTSNVPENVLLAITRLGKCIRANLYMIIHHNSEINVYEAFYYIYKLMESTPDSDVGFDIYVMIALVKYIQDETNDENASTYVQQMLHTRSIPCDPLILHTCNEICKYGRFESLCNECDSPIDNIEYICVMKRYDIQQSDTLYTALETIATCEFVNDTHKTKALLEQKFKRLLFPYFFRCTKIHNDIFVWDLHADTILNTSNTASDKDWLAPFDKLVQPAILAYFHAAGMRTKSTRNTFILNLFKDYVSTRLPGSVVVNHGKYKFFIKTDIGVFCTITGCYYRPVPFLHFRAATQSKLYCIKPNTKNLNIDINAQCIKYVDKYEQPFADLLKNNDLSWFSDVFFPGMGQLDTIKTMTHTKVSDILVKLSARLDTLTEFTQIKDKFDYLRNAYAIQINDDQLITTACCLAKIELTKKLQRKISTKTFITTDPATAMHASRVTCEFINKLLCSVKTTIEW